MNTTLFTNHIEVFTSKVKKLSKLNKLIALYRFLTFILGSILIYFLYEKTNWLFTSLASISIIIIFLWLIQFHEKIKNKLSHYKILIQINKDEINRFNHNFTDLNRGEKYIDSKHEYTSDLDIFGSNSLFQLLNRTATSIGENQLVNWLKNTSSPSTIVLRQEAIDELEEQLDWRQKFQAHGKSFEQSDQGVTHINDWIKEKEHFIFDRRFVILAYSLPFLTVLSILTTFNNFTHFYIPLFFISINFYLLKQKKNYLHKLKVNTSQQVNVLNSYLKLFEAIENKKFNTKTLQKIQKELIQEQKASNTIQLFFKHLNALDMSSNPIWAFIGNGIFLWDLHHAIRLYYWKQNFSIFIPNWLKSLAEFDAITSLAGYNFLHNDWIIPSLNEKIYGIEATKVGHPLLPKEQRIYNPISLNGKGKVSVITGANMSGKSTYLRTVGINLVLANLGVRVCAESFNFSTFQLFSSMRTLDSLKNNTSSFYAELLRLKDLIQLAKKEERILFLLDEILKGTNSKDRYDGAKALINQLSKLNTIGYISTHDLELSELANSEKIKNYSFNSEVKGEKILFDYLLTDGFCSSFNASQLMRNIGIDLD